MAVTFRDFFLGLADAMPKIANTYMAYLDYNYKQQELAMEATRTKAQVEYYGAGTESEKAQTRKLNMEIDEFPKLAEIKMEIEKENRRVAQLARMEAEGKHDYIMANGGYPKYLKDKEDLSIQEIQARIQALKDTSLSETAQKKLAEFQLQATESEYMLNTFVTMGTIGGKEGQEVFGKMLQEGKVDPTDMQAVLKYGVDNGIDYIPAESRKAMYDSYRSMATLSTGFEITVENTQKELLASLLDPTEKGDNARLFYAGKKGKLDPDKLKEVLETNRANMYSLPFYQRINMSIAFLSQELGIPTQMGGFQTGQSGGTGILDSSNTMGQMYGDTLTPYKKQEINPSASPFSKGVKSVKKNISKTPYPIY